MIQIIPAIDIIGGKCVRLTRGDYAQKKTYNQHPVEVAKEFEDNGLKRLHLVDLDGAKAKHIVNYKVLEQIASKTSLIIDFGGGIKSNDDIRIAFESGANQITGGSIAVKDRLLFKSWIQKYGTQKIILGADVKDRKIAVSGWQENTSEDLFDFIGEYARQGIEYAICTDIDKDGMLQGASLDLYREIREQFPKLKLIASGGVSSLSEIEKLNQAGLFGAIVGKAIYEGNIGLKALRNFVENT